MIVVARNRGGSYILAELTRAVWQWKVARFRVVPYYAREKIDIPEGIMRIIDTDEEGLEKIWSQPDEEVALDKDYLMHEIRMFNSDDSDNERESNIDDDIHQDK